MAAARVSDFAAAAQAYAGTDAGDDSQRFADRFGVAPTVLAAVAAGPAWRLEVAAEGPTPVTLFLVKLNDADQPLAPLAGDFGDAIESLQANGSASVPARDGAATSWVLRGDWLALGADPNVARAVVESIAPSEAAGAQHYAGVPALEVATPGTEFQWWIDPWSDLRGRVDRGAADEEQQSAWAGVERHALQEMQAWCGLTVLPPAGPPVAEAFVLAPQPRTGTLRMLTATPTDTLRVPEWLAGASSLVVLHADVPAALQHADRLMDGLIADGIDGTYRDILTDLKAPDGLDIDVETELYPHLGPRVFLATGDSGDAKDEPTPLLVVFETDDVSKVAAALRTLMAPDEEVTLIERPEVGGEIWRINSSEVDGSPCVATVHQHAVYATDTRLLEDLLAPATDEQRARLERINQVLELQGAELTQRPAFALIGSPAAGAQDQGIADARDAVVISFFDSPGASPADDADAFAGVVEFTERLFADRVALGFVEEGGWRLAEAPAAPAE